MDRWSVHVAELIGIFYVVSTVFKISHRRPRTEYNGTTATILCDSNSALQAIENPGNKSGQRIIHAILQALAEVQAKESRFVSNGYPDTAAIRGTTQQIGWPKPRQARAKHTPSPLLTTKRALIRDKIRAQWEREWKASTKCGRLRKIDSSLLAAYTWKLYGNRTCSGVGRTC
jgi:hypothetical protein